MRGWSIARSPRRALPVCSVMRTPAQSATRDTSLVGAHHGFFGPRYGAGQDRLQTVHLLFDGLCPSCKRSHGVSFPCLPQDSAGVTARQAQVGWQPTNLTPRGRAGRHSRQILDHTAQGERPLVLCAIRRRWASSTRARLGCPRLDRIGAGRRSSYTSWTMSPSRRTKKKPTEQSAP